MALFTLGDVADILDGALDTGISIIDTLAQLSDIADEGKLDRKKCFESLQIDPEKSEVTPEKHATINHNNNRNNNKDSHNPCGDTEEKSDSYYRLHGETTNASNPHHGNKESIIDSNNNSSSKTDQSFYKIHFDESDLLQSTVQTQITSFQDKVVRRTNSPRLKSRNRTTFIVGDSLSNSNDSQDFTETIASNHIDGVQWPTTFVVGEPTNKSDLIQTSIKSEPTTTTTENSQDETIVSSKTKFQRRTTFVLGDSPIKSVEDATTQGIPIITALGDLCNVADDFLKDYSGPDKDSNNRGSIKSPEDVDMIISTKVSEILESFKKLDSSVDMIKKKALKDHLSHYNDDGDVFLTQLPHKYQELLRRTHSMSDQENFSTENPLVDLTSLQSLTDLASPRIGNCDEKEIPHGEEAVPVLDSHSSPVLVSKREKHSSTKKDRPGTYVIPIHKIDQIITSPDDSNNPEVNSNKPEGDSFYRNRADISPKNTIPRSIPNESSELFHVRSKRGKLKDSSSTNMFYQSPNTTLKFPNGVQLFPIDVDIDPNDSDSEDDCAFNRDRPGTYIISKAKKDVVEAPSKEPTNYFDRNNRPGTYVISKKESNETSTTVDTPVTIPNIQNSRSKFLEERQSLTRSALLRFSRLRAASTDNYSSKQNKSPVNRKTRASISLPVSRVTSPTRSIPTPTSAIVSPRSGLSSNVTSPRSGVSSGIVSPLSEFSSGIVSPRSDVITSPASNLYSPRSVESLSNSPAVSSRSNVSSPRSLSYLTSNKCSSASDLYPEEAFTSPVSSDHSSDIINNLEEEYSNELILPSTTDSNYTNNLRKEQYSERSISSDNLLVDEDSLFSDTSISKKNFKKRQRSASTDTMLDSPETSLEKSPLKGTFTKSQPNLLTFVRDNQKLSIASETVNKLNKLKTAMSTSLTKLHQLHEVKRHISLSNSTLTGSDVDLTEPRGDTNSPYREMTSAVQDIDFSTELKRSNSEPCLSAISKSQITESDMFNSGISKSGAEHAAVNTSKTTEVNSPLFTGEDSLIPSIDENIPDSSEPTSPQINTTAVVFREKRGRRQNIKDCSTYVLHNNGNNAMNDNCSTYVLQRDKPTDKKRELDINCSTYILQKDLQENAPQSSLHDNQNFLESQKSNQPSPVTEFQKYRSKTFTNTSQYSKSKEKSLDTTSRSRTSTKLTGKALKRQSLLNRNKKIKSSSQKQDTENEERLNESGKSSPKNRSPLHKISKRKSKHGTTLKGREKISVKIKTFSVSNNISCQTVW